MDYSKMSRPIYGYKSLEGSGICSAPGTGTCAPCVYTIPEGQNVQTYIEQVNAILNSFKANSNKENKEKAIERLQTLYTLLAAVRSKST